MEHIIRVRALGVAAILAAGAAISFITSTVVASRAYTGRAQEAARAQQEVTVKGSARVNVRADMAVWTIHVSGHGTELKDAYGVLDFGAERVHAFLRDQGFPDSELSLSAIDTTTHFVREKDGRESSHIASYTLRRRFTVTSTAVERVAQAAGEVTTLLQENVRVTSSSPEYTYTKVGDLRVEILGKASRDARNRAERIASSSGCRVGEVRRVSMGVIQITRPHSTDVSSYGIYDTTTIDKDVSVVVTATFAVKP